jgi:hypothetical protein
MSAGRRWRRPALLAALVAAGVAAGWVGETLSGDPFWYLAIPAFVAAGWLFVADPGACLDSCRADRRTQAPGERRLP